MNTTKVNPLPLGMVKFEDAQSKTMALTMEKCLSMILMNYAED